MLGMSDESDDEIGDVSDADMFLETRESKLLNNPNGDGSKTS